jgi:hypothetical protein
VPLDLPRLALGAFLFYALLAGLAIEDSMPVSGLSAPTWFAVGESAAVAALCFAALALRKRAARALERIKVLSWKPKLSFPLRAALAVAFAYGTFGFLLRTTADVLGGYFGLGFAFTVYPQLMAAYHWSGLSYFSWMKPGVQGFSFFGLAFVSFVALGAGRGLGRSLWDAVTVYAAPLIAAFELALWNSAPEDMSWHVTTFLWVGGVNDGGVRCIYWVNPCLAGGGDYIFSNWFVLFTALALVATRVLWPGEGRVAGEGRAGLREEPESRDLFFEDSDCRSGDGGSGRGQLRSGLPRLRRRGLAERPGLL